MSNSYPKQILSQQQQLQALIDAGMVISSVSDAKSALDTIGYYRLRGYSFPFYDNKTRTYASGCSLENILKLYRFDMKLSHLLFGMLSQIEIALRSRTSNALVTAYGDALILNNPIPFRDKTLYWQNLAVISSEISRSRDVFIQHQLRTYDGLVPIWSVVEVLSFGTLSKLIKNLKTGANSAYSILAEHYRFPTASGKLVKPSQDMLTTWIHASTILRNMCAHNARIYDRTLATKPAIIDLDKTASKQHKGVYLSLLAMKYLRPSNQSWNNFSHELKSLINQYSNTIQLSVLGFPNDWEAHLKV